MRLIEQEAYKKGYIDGSLSVTEEILSRSDLYQQGRADELDKISKMILIGCDELKCDDCGYKEYSQDVCQQAFTIGMIENYMAEQLKERNE